MAYHQNKTAGRGNHPKTGHGIPSPLMQEEPNYDAANKMNVSGRSLYGASTNAFTALNENAPEQAKHLLEKEGRTKVNGQYYGGVKIDAKEATKQTMVAQDSLNAIKNYSDPKIRAEKGQAWSNMYSPNNKNAATNLSSRDYGTPGSYKPSWNDIKVRNERAVNTLKTLETLSSDPKKAAAQLKINNAALNANTAVNDLVNRFTGGKMKKAGKK